MGMTFPSKEDIMNIVYFKINYIQKENLLVKINWKPLGKIIY
jgi:hypothetical protein